MQPISTQNAACYIILSLKLLTRCGRYPSIPSVPTGPALIIRPARKMASSGRDDHCMQPISTQNAACYIILSLKLLNRCGRYPSIPSVPTGSVYYTLLVTKYSVFEDNLLLSKSVRPERWHQAVVTIIV